jgi:hypothetical protein
MTTASFSMTAAELAAAARAMAESQAEIDGEELRRYVERQHVRFERDAATFEAFVIAQAAALAEALKHGRG